MDEPRDIRITLNGVFEKLPTSDGKGVEVTITQKSDPAYWLLTDENTHHSTPNMDIYRENCYICRDPEFAQMGLPLCKPCEACKIGHVAADDTVCDECGADAQELYYRAREAECKANGHTWKTIPEHTLNITRQETTALTDKWVTAPEVQPAVTYCTNCGFSQND